MKLAAVFVSRSHVTKQLRCEITALESQAEASRPG
jgi:hypothetical protein